MTSVPATTADPPPRGRRRGRVVWLGLGVAVYAASRIAAAYTVAGNWDEFALLERATDTAATGVLHGGGRPGLATLVLVPLAADCRDEIATLRHARLLWAGMSLALLAGLGVLLRQLGRHTGARPGDAWLGVALLALVPAFLEWSIQVRTDQLALVLALWGGVALLASQRQPWLAAVAGAALGAGYLATQKAVYVAALVGVLACGQLWLTRELRPARELLRALACAGAAALTLLAFHSLTTAALTVPERTSALESVTPKVVSQQMSEFAYYRNTIGFDQYREILPTLVPHGLLLVALLVAAVAAARSRAADGRVLAVVAAVLALGLAVGAFHASAFAYFWMTLGLFPAVALALAAEPIRRHLAPHRPDLARLAAWGLWSILCFQGAARMAEMGIDTQAVQRESLAFLHRNFAEDDAGFHPEHAPFCRDEAAPIRLYFSQVLYRHFGGEHRDHHTRLLLADLRERPVKFVLQSFRLNQFPVEIRRFLAENYQPYRASVFVAGRSLAGRSGDRADFELIVSGRYRWLPVQPARAIAVDARTVQPGEVVELSAGAHTASFPEDVPGGILVLAVDDPPGIAPLAFYKSY